MGEEPSSSFLGILIVFFSYGFLTFYVSWIFSDCFPKPIAELYPPKVYRLVLPGIIFIAILSYFLFNWVCWQIEIQNEKFRQEV